jgi:fructokinase
MFVVGGESLVDLKAGVTLPGGQVMDRDGDGQIVMTAHAGGSPYNCAIALGRLGNRTGFHSPFSADAFGDYLMAPLAAAGVHPLLPERVRDYTTLAVVNFDEARNARYGFYRGADAAIDRDRALAALPDEIWAYQVGGFCPVGEAQAPIWLDVVEAAARRGATISIDPNIRPSLIDDFAAYRRRLDRFLALAHIVKMSEEDLAALDAAIGIEAHARALLAMPNCRLVVVTLGENGSRAFARGGVASAGVYRPAQFGDTVGAGDSLMAGILHWLHHHDALAPKGLANLDAAALGQMLRFGATVAGINCGRKGCQPPTLAEVNAALA